MRRRENCENDRSRKSAALTRNKKTKANSDSPLSAIIGSYSDDEEENAFRIAKKGSFGSRNCIDAVVVVTVGEDHVSSIS